MCVWFVHLKFCVFLQQPKPSDDFYLDLGDLPKSYANLMKDIPRRLEEIIKAEAPSTSKGRSSSRKSRGSYILPRVAHFWFISRLIRILQILEECLCYSAGKTCISRDFTPGVRITVYLIYSLYHALYY